MNKNKKATIPAKDCSSNTDLANESTVESNSKKGENDIKNYNTTQTEFQYTTRGLSKLSHTLTSFVCDECSLPLYLYGENYIESYTDGRADVLRCFCDNHASEFGFLGVTS